MQNPSTWPGLQRFEILAAPNMLQTHINLKLLHNMLQVQVSCTYSKEASYLSYLPVIYKVVTVSAQHQGNTARHTMILNCFNLTGILRISAHNDVWYRY